MNNRKSVSKKTVNYLGIFLFIVLNLFFLKDNLCDSRADSVTYDVFIRLDSLHGMCGYIEDFWPNTILPANSFEGVAWTSGGFYYVGRSLIRFDLTFIPSNATINSAYLSLYHNPTPDPPGGHAGSNSCYLQRVTSNWNEYTVTWNNQPTTSTTNQIILPASGNGTQDYLYIDVKGFISQMVSNPNSNYGLFIKLLTEQTYRNLDFASGHCTDTTLRPRLEINYTTPVGIKPISSQIPANFNLFQNYPNPFNPTTMIKFDIAKNSFVILKVYDMLGREIKTIINNEFLNAGNYEIQFDGNSLSSGVYIYKFIAGDFIKSKQMIVLK